MRRRFLLLGVFAVLLLAAAACGGGGEEAGGEGTTGGGGECGSGSISLMGIWVSDEQKSIQAVIDSFEQKCPEITVKYNPAGDNLPTVLATAVQGGNPPDLAAIAQPALVQQYVDGNDVKPIDFAADVIQENFGASGTDIGTFNGKLYGLFFKAANKSLVWYNVPAYNDAGVEPVDNWDDFLQLGETLKASGVPAYSIGGAEGWTLTDLFENIYLRSAGPDMYDKLAAHDIPWTDPSVKDALTEMAKIIGDPDNIAGGTEGALQTDNATAITNTFTEPPKGAQYLEGDFVSSVILDSTKAKPESGFNVYVFPSINDSKPSALVSGDTVVMFKSSPAAEAFIKYLATPEAAEIWAHRGGFATLNKNVDPNSYPDAITRKTAAGVSEAEVSRFDLSDLQPPDFGATVGQGEFKLFQDFLANPDDVDGIAQKLEDAASKAYGG